jgi:vancomycin permeability regulator SanA
LLATIALPAVAFVVSALAIVWDGLNDKLGIANVGIVLGNKVETNGFPSPRLQARLDKTIELYKQGFFSEIIVSGSVGREGYDEAKVMKRYLAQRGIPEKHIYVDSDGKTTYLTAKNAQRIMREKHWQSAFVISQYFHISRTKLALKKFGISPLYSAHADFFEFRDGYSTVREVIGFYAYLLRGYD